MAIHLEYSVTARCTPEQAWKKFQVLEQWPWWNRLIAQSRWLEGQPWQKGSRFLMQVLRPRNVTFRPVIVDSNPPHKVGWVGKGPGITGEHWFSFEPQSDGVTLLKTWEDFSGYLTFLWGAGTRKSIVAMYAEWLEALKTEVEKIAREEYTRS